jgi:demethylmenaquinone methyltransferase/2-methoxy-6-polyprenyl-1,4-benzoquinol methylase
MGHPRRVLDVGCGTGILFPLLLATAAQVVGLDPSEGMLRQAGCSPARAHLLVRSPIESAPLASNSFDWIVCNSVFPHFTDPVRACAAMHRMLCPAGSLLICHVDGRETINAIHRRKEAVKQHLLPSPAALKTMLVQVGFVNVSIADLVDRFVVWAEKPMKRRC